MQGHSDRKELGSQWPFKGMPGWPNFLCNKLPPYKSTASCYFHGLGASSFTHGTGARLQYPAAQITYASSLENEQQMSKGHHYHRNSQVVVMPPTGLEAHTLSEGRSGAEEPLPVVPKNCGWNIHEKSQASMGKFFS